MMIQTLLFHSRKKHGGEKHFLFDGEKKLIEKLRLKREAQCEVTAHVDIQEETFFSLR